MIDALLSRSGIIDAITVIEEFMVYVCGTQDSKLEETEITKFILADFGYEVFSFKEDRNSDWQALKKKHGIE